MCEAGGVPAFGLVARYPMNGGGADISGCDRHAVTHHVTTTADRFGASRNALHFNGIDSVLTIPDDADFSVATTGFLTVSVWVRPEASALNDDDELLYASTQGSGYVHWFGKGDTSGSHGNREWSFRIYSADNTEQPNRHNRMSFYLFGHAGGLGPGCHVQDPVANGTWMHLAATVSQPEQRICWYKNGELRDSTGFGPTDSYPLPDAVLRNGTAPVRMGSQDGRSHFKGAIDDVCIYNRALSVTEIIDLYHAPAD
jgi:Concanavalin A-like lectin/glucanases superfamily